MDENGHHKISGDILEKSAFQGWGAYFRLMMLFALLSGVVVGLGYLVGGIETATMFLGVSLFMNLLAYLFSDKLVLMSTGAKVLSKDESPRLQAIVSSIAAKAGMKEPRIAIVKSQQPNAFATGRNAENAVVVTTTGLMDMMTDEEVEAVIGHEISHVIHKDMLVMTIAVAMATAVSYIANMIFYSLFWGGYSGRDRREGGSNLALIGAAITAPLAATLIQLAISRGREYYADEGSALLTKKPSNLVSALTKIDGFIKRGARINAPPSTSSLWIMNPFSRMDLVDIFSTHPSTAKRIERLREIQNSLGTP